MTKFNHIEQLGQIPQPITLPVEFPVSNATLHMQADKEITDLHHHNYLEIGYCYEGSGVFIIEDQIHLFQAGDASLIHKGRIHLAQSTKGTVSKWRFLSLDALNLTQYLNWENKNLIQQWQTDGQSWVLKKEVQTKSVEIIRDIIEEIVTKNEYYQSIVKLKVGELAMQTLREDRTKIKDNKTINSKNLQRILPAVQYILSSYAHPIKIDYLANLCHLSTSQFRKVFVSAMCTSPQNYLLSIRLNHADQLLQTTDLKIVTIAQQVGFATLSSFNRIFQLTRQRKPKNSRKPNSV